MGCRSAERPSCGMAQALQLQFACLQDAPKRGEGCRGLGVSSYFPGVLVTLVTNRLASCNPVATLSSHQSPPSPANSASASAVFPVRSPLRCAPNIREHRLGSCWDHRIPDSRANISCLPCGSFDISYTELHTRLSNSLAPPRSRGHQRLL